MSPKIIPLPARRRNPDRAAVELRAIRRELAELLRQIAALTPPAPWGLGCRP